MRPILIAGANFGCGSSREAAVWALKGMGLRVVIADSFGDIFAANCFQNGILPITLSDSAGGIARQMPRAAARHFTVDLEALAMTVPGLGAVPFTVDASQRAALLEGADEIDRTLRLTDRIGRWQAEDSASPPMGVAGFAVRLQSSECSPIESPKRQRADEK